MDEFYYPFGIIGLGQEVEHAFSVTNAGDQDLLILLQACTRCGAPDACIGRDTLAPGESTDLTVKFTVSYPGNVMKSVKLMTNDIRQPVAFVTLHGKVPHDLRVYPDRLYVGADKGEVASCAVTVSGPAEMELKEVSCDKSLFDIRVGEPEVSEDEKKTWQLKLTFTDKNFVGNVEDQLSIDATHQERPLITVPITRQIRADLGVSPPGVFLGFVEPGENAQQTVEIESRTEAVFAIKAATSVDPKIRVGEPSERDGVWFIPVSVDTSRAAVVDGSVSVMTDVPGEDALEIAVYAHITGEE